MKLLEEIEQKRLNCNFGYMSAVALELEKQGFNTWIDIKLGVPTLRICGNKGEAISIAERRFWTWTQRGMREIG